MTPSIYLQSHDRLSRRFFLGLGAAGLAAWNATTARAAAPLDPKVAEAVAELEYLTPPAKARILGRGNPPPNKLPAEEFPRIGLTPGTWFLEVTPDPDSNSEVDNPLSRELGNALDWKGLMKLAETRAVRYLHVCTCTNVPDPFHMSLWEGVLLRDVIWMARPKAKVRRAVYYGYTGPRSQRFRSSLPLGRILEDAPGELPVILAYKMNGQFLSAKLGGPVRVIVPGSYGNKWIKWVQYIRLTNDYKANDTYAVADNDVESPVKTQARFIHVPESVEADKPVAVTGLAQVGMSGLSEVQYFTHPNGKAWDDDDPYLTKAAWTAATLLPPPGNWGGGLPGGKLPPVPAQIDPQTGAPRTWPLRDTIVHWAALLPGFPPGEHDLYCRTIDANGIAQPMPRPLPRTGANQIQRVKLTAAG